MNIFGFRLSTLGLLLTSVLCPLTPVSAMRELAENRKVEIGQKKKESHQIFQAESVKLTGTYTQNGRPVDLSATNSVVVWEINGWTDYTNTYALCTGTVSSASNTVVFNLTPAACNLPPGTYLGFVRALHSVSNALVQDLVLSYQTIAVEWSPGSTNYSMVSPLPAPQIGIYTNPAIWFLSSAPRREISQVWKVEEAPTVLIPTKFFQSEGIGLNGRATKSGAALDLSDTNTIYVWEINGWNDYMNTYAIALGTALTNGQLRFELPPWQSNLSNGTYRGFVRSLTSDGTNLTTSEVLARQTIAVEWSPDSRHYSIVGPYTQPIYYTTNVIVGPQGLPGTNGLSAYQLAVSTGYVGSVSQWLASLVGAAGTNDAAQIADNTQSIVNLTGDISTALSALSGVSQRVERVVAGTDAFEGILLDTEIHSWGEIGLTYTNAVRMNSAVTISNDAVWTGWTTTGSLLTNGAIFLTAGQYLQSPVQSNGVSSVTLSAGSDMDATSYSEQILVGSNEVNSPYRTNDAVYKITAGSTLSLATPGLNVSNVTITGYINPPEAAMDKTVSGLKIIDPPTAEQDVVNKLYSDAGDAGSLVYTDNQLAAYNEDETKTVKGAQLRLNQSWQAMTDNGTDYILSCGEISGDGQLIGTSNYFSLAQNDSPLLTFRSDKTGLYINSFTRTRVDATNVTISLNIATNGVLSAPFAEYTTNLVVGSWTHVLTYSSNTYPTAVGSNYVLKFTAPTGARGFFRAMQPAGQSRITVAATIFDLGSNAVQNVKSITFTNGWSIVCSTNGLQFKAP